MHAFFVVLVAVAVFASQPAFPQAIQPRTQTTSVSAETKAQVDTSRQAFMDAYSAGNVDALMTAYHPAATFAGTLQPFWIRGYDEIADLWRRYFGAWPQRRLIFRDVNLDQYGEGTTVETGYLEMHMTRPETREYVPTYIRYSITRVLSDGRWLIVNMNVARIPN
jgi:ketosteroid isomerase-like protein